MKNLTFGRDINCDICISDATKTVSRKHGVLIEENGTVYIEDTNSTNGIYVNGKRISKRVQLHHYDKVMLGNKIPLKWKTYMPIDTDGTIRINNPDNMSDSLGLDSPALINVPNHIEINQNNADIYKNGEHHADFKVPFRREMGENIGNSVGKTLGCIFSLAIVVAVIGLICLVVQ